MTRKLAKIFSVFLLFTGTAHGAAFQFGGLRLDALSVTSSGSATQLTKSDYQVRNVTGSATDVEKLPDATTLQAGYWYEFINSSSGALTVSNTSSTSVTSLTTGQSAKVYLTNNSTANGTWVVSSGAGSGGGGGGGGSARFTLGGNIVPFVAIDGAHYQTATQSLTTVNLSCLNSGSSGSTVFQVNQYRSGALQGSATASLTASSSAPAGSAASLSGTLSLLAGDVITVDINSGATGASDCSLEY